MEPAKRLQPRSQDFFKGKSYGNEVEGTGKICSLLTLAIMRFRGNFQILLLLERRISLIVSRTSFYRGSLNRGSTVVEINRRCSHTSVRLQYRDGCIRLLASWACDELELRLTIIV